MFTKAKLEIYNIDVEDIITTSGDEGGNGGIINDEDADLDM